MADASERPVRPPRPKRDRKNSAEKRPAADVETGTTGDSLDRATSPSTEEQSCQLSPPSQADTDKSPDDTSPSNDGTSPQPRPRPVPRPRNRRRKAFNSSLSRQSSVASPPPLQDDEQQTEEQQCKDVDQQDHPDNSDQSHITPPAAEADLPEQEYHGEDDALATDDNPVAPPRPPRPVRHQRDVSEEAVPSTLPLQNAQIAATDVTHVADNDVPEISVEPAGDADVVDRRSSANSGQRPARPPPPAQSSSSLFSTGSMGSDGSMLRERNLTVASILSPSEEEGRDSDSEVDVPARRGSASAGDQQSFLSLSTSAGTTTFDDETPEERRIRKRLRSVEEIVDTEKKYVQVLRLLDDHFRTSCVQAGLDQQLLQRVFGISDKIKDLHVRLLGKLQKRWTLWMQNQSDAIADVLEPFVEDFRLYSSYNSKLEQALKAVPDLRQSNPLFRDVVAKCEQAPECRMLKLETFLLEPMERLPRYILLVRAYLKYTPEANTDYAACQDVIDKIHGQVQACELVIRERENAKKLIGLQQLMPSVNLLRSGRTLIKQGKLQKVCRKDLQPRVVILMSDIFIYAHEEVALSTQYVKPCIVELATIDVAVYSTPDNKPAFQVTSSSRSFIMVCSTVKERDDWINAVKQALPEKFDDDLHRQLPFAQAPLWIPDERASMCMLCSLPFSGTRRRHHCRGCGKVVCNKCSPFKTPLGHVQGRSERVCAFCYKDAILFPFQDGTKPDRAALAELQRAERRIGDINRTLEKNRGALNQQGRGDPDAYYDGYVQVHARTGGKTRKTGRVWLSLKRDSSLLMYRAPDDVTAVDGLPLPGYMLNYTAERDRHVLELRAGPQSLVFSVNDESVALWWKHAIEEGLRLAIPETGRVDETDEHAASQC